MCENNQSRICFLLYVVVMSHCLTGNLARCGEPAWKGEARKKAHTVNVTAYGSNVLVILPGADKYFKSDSSFVSLLTTQDVEGIAKGCASVITAAPVARSSGEVLFKERRWTTAAIIGTTPLYLTVRDWTKLMGGAAFSADDIRESNAVCLLGQTVSRELFHGQSPLAQEVKIKGHLFRVIGVLGKKGLNSMNVDQDDVILVPFKIVDKLLEATGRRKDTADSIWVKLSAPGKLPIAAKEIAAVLRAQHRIARGKLDDFNLADVTNRLDGPFVPFKE
jgi:putative ABC transport system permease protein